MPVDMLLALVAFAFPATWTPGPNNMMLAASGATYGWRATLAHALGVPIGFSLMAFAISLGLGQVFLALPAIATGMAWVGGAIMLWLAWRIATAAPPGEAPDGPSSGTRGRPLTFLEAAAFQWINPKAWVLSIGVASGFVRAEKPLADALVILGVFLVAGLTSAQGWVLFGTAAARLLGRGLGLRLFNLAMALLLGAAALWLMVEA